MKRRFKNGVELADRAFGEQEWTRGLLPFTGNALYLCQSTPHSKPSPFGKLYRPVLKACYSDTITFGIELEERQWLVQVGSAKWAANERR